MKHMPVCMTIFNPFLACLVVCTMCAHLLYVLGFAHNCNAYGMDINIKLSGGLCAGE